MSAVLARRITVVTPRARIDLSLPVQSPVAELLPQLVRIAGAGGAGPAGLGGWVLSRLDGIPLEAAATPASAGIRDGDLLYLNPADLAPEPLVFDDAVDAIASAAGERHGTWCPAVSRGVAAGTAGVALAAIAVLAALGLTWPAAPLAAGGVAAVLLVAGTAVARAFGDSTVGAVLAAAGLPGALLGGLVAFGGRLVGYAGLGVGLAAVAVYAVLAALAVADRAAWFLPAVLAGGAGGVAVAASVGFGFRPAATAAVAILGCVAASPLLSALALRLGGLPRPRVPADMAAFRRDEGPTQLRAQPAAGTPGAVVGHSTAARSSAPNAFPVRSATAAGSGLRGGTRAAARSLGGLVAGTAAVALGAIAVLLGEGGRWAWALAGTTGVVLLLRARAYTGTGPRGALLCAGALALLATGMRAAAAGGTAAGLGLLAALAVAGAACAAHAVRGPQPPSPYWSRLFDIAEWLAVIGIVPLAAAVAGVFPAVRALGG